MEVKDDRTAKSRNYNIVIAKDKFMSGWGMARKGSSYCAWAAPDGAIQALLAWVESRDDMVHVRIAGPNTKPPKTCAHYHIYEVNENHPAYKEYKHLLLDRTSVAG